MHGSFSGVIKESDEDVFFVCREPAILRSENAFYAGAGCLGRRRRKVKPCQNAYESSQSALNSKQVSPALFQSSVTTQVEDAKGQEGTDDLRGLVCRPEPREPFRKLGILVVV